MEKVFLITSQKLAVADCSVQEEFAFLENNSLPCIRYVRLSLVFLQTSFFLPLVPLLLSPETAPRAPATAELPLAFYCVLLIQ